MQACSNAYRLFGRRLVIFVVGALAGVAIHLGYINATNHRKDRATVHRKDGTFVCADFDRNTDKWFDLFRYPYGEEQVFKTASDLKNDQGSAALALAISPRYFIDDTSIYAHGNGDDLDRVSIILLESDFAQPSTGLLLAIVSRLDDQTTISYGISYGSWIYKTYAVTRSRPIGQYAHEWLVRHLSIDHGFDKDAWLTEIVGRQSMHR